MRPDGLVERFHEIKRLQSQRDGGRADGYTDLLGFYRMIEQSWITYQSTHLHTGYSGEKEVYFPFAWQLEEGDIVRDITENRSYRVSRVEKIIDEGSRTSSEFPDIESWKSFVYRGRWTDSLSSGWVGFKVLLVDEESGKPVLPNQYNVLLFKNDRYMTLGRYDLVKSDDRHVVNPADESELTEVTRLGLPAVTLYKRRDEPSSMTGKWFASSGKVLKPKLINSNTDAHPTLTLDTKWMPKDIILQFKLYAQTAYDLDKLEIYTQRFVERMAGAWRKNGLMEWAAWQNPGADRRLTRTSQHTVEVEYAFRVANLSVELSPKRLDLDLDGPYVNTKESLSEGSNVLGEPLQVKQQ